MIKEEIIAHLNDMSGEDLVRLVNEINSTDGSLDSIDYQLFDEEFFSVYFTDPMEAARATYFGDIKNWNDDYVRFNAYGNLESENDYSVKNKILDYVDEISDWIIERGTTDIYQDADAFQEILDSAEEDDENKEDIEESVSDKNKDSVVTLTVSKEDIDEMNRILGLDAGETTIEDAGYYEDTTVFIKTAKFGDGYEADIRVEAGQENFYLNPVLYDVDGYEISVLDPYGNFDGEYNFEDGEVKGGGNHIVIIKAE